MARRLASDVSGARFFVQESYHCRVPAFGARIVFRDCRTKKKLFFIPVKLTLMSILLYTKYLPTLLNEYER